VASCGSERVLHSGLPKPWQPSCHPPPGVRCVGLAYHAQHSHMPEKIQSTSALVFTASATFARPNMPPKRKQRRDAVPVNASQATSFSDLPAAVLSELARQCKYGWFNRRGGHPLLAVCRATRDGVLASLTRINLTVSAACQPDARLLAKVASQAPPGLEIKLRLQDDHALLTLLQAGVYSKGWARVHSLLVRASTGSRPVTSMTRSLCKQLAGLCICTLAD
jgi:hypothetical protein